MICLNVSKAVVRYLQVVIILNYDDILRCT